MSNNRITPFIKRMRTNGGTIYTFSSAVEDIGLNINERNNVVKISHFALLDIPLINEPASISENRFNVQAIVGNWEYSQNNPSIKDGRVLIAESFQNYALNLESNLLNQDTYNATLTRTVSERVFWKWLKETGAIRWSKDVSVGTTQYWSEEIDADGDAGYNSVVKYIGKVSAGNVRTDTFGTYNETYILVPTSHGQTDAYFQIIEDDNYKHKMEIGDLGEKILGRESWTLPQPDGLDFRAYYDFVDSSTQVGTTPYYTYYDNSTGSYSSGWWYTAEGISPTSTDNAYLIDSSAYIDNNIYNVDLKYDDGGGSTIEFRRSKVDCLSLVFDDQKLKDIYSDPGLTYDKMSIQYAIQDSFNFNSVLIYYTVYNSTMDEVLGRNLLGILFLDAPSGNSSNIGFDGITIPSLEKIQSSAAGGFGTSYSLRLNIKTDNMVDDTQATIVDQATSDQLYAEDWTEAFSNLNTAINILTQNNSTINYISEQYTTVKNTQTQILNDIENLQWTVNDINRDIAGTANVIPMFADGDDPIVDSSIYMKFGNIGLKIKEPEYPIHLKGTTKADDIIIENSIKDTSGNILLGYGSPLQLGSYTNYRDIAMYTGDIFPILYIDSSVISLNSDVSIAGELNVEGSTNIGGTLNVNKITYPNFDFETSYIRDTSNGATLSWFNGFLEASIKSTISADGSIGAIQFANNAGLMGSDEERFRYDASFGRLAIGKSESDFTLDVSGIINVNGLFYLNGAEFDPGANITNPGNNRLLTSDGTENGINGETNLEFTGNTLTIKGTTYDWKVGTNVPGSANSLFLQTGSSKQFEINPTTAATWIRTKLYLPNISTSPQTYGLFYNPTTDEVTYYTATSGGGISWSGSTSNGIGTYVNSTTIQAEPNLKFDSGTNILTVTGTVAATTVTGANITSGSNPGHTHTGTSISSLDAGDITTGTLPVTRGGTGRTSGYNYTEWDAAYTHVYSTGSNHSYINQAVTTTSSPTFTGANLTGGRLDDVVYIRAYSSSGIIFEENGGVQNFLMADDGDFHARQDIVAYSSTVSDIRLKKDIEKLENSLEKILQLEGISYKTKNNDKVTHFGLIAQETEKILPEIIKETEILGEDKEITYKTIRYGEIIPHLIEAIKEQQKQINALKEEIIEIKKL